MGLFSDAAENRKRRNQAAKYRKEGKEYIKKGEEIYDKAYADVSFYVYETGVRIDEHTKYKKGLVEKFDLKIRPIIKQFDQFDIDRKTYKIPESLNLSKTSGAMVLAASSLSGASNFSISRGTFLGLIPSIIDWFSDADEEYYDSLQFKTDARFYYNQMKLERTKLRITKDQMNVIRTHMADERKLLGGMMRRMDDIAETLKVNMQIELFTEAEATYLKGIHKICERISKLVMTKFIDDNYSITDEYKNAYKRIQQLNEQLMSAPTVQDPSILLGILEAVIVN